MKFKSFNRHSMFSQISLVAGGTVIAQGLTMLCTPVLSRIYSPEDFGVMSVFASFMSILVPLSSMRYFLSIALPKTKRYSDACLVLSFFLEVVTTIIFFLVALLFGNKLLESCGTTKLIPYKFLLPIGIFLYATYMLLTQWAIRNAIFGVIARTKITQSVSGNAVKIGMGLLGIKPLGLIIGTIISYGGGITSILREMFRKGFPQSCKRDIKRVAIRYRKFPQFDVFSSVMDVAGPHLVPIVVFSYFGARVSGFYSMSQQLLVIPSVFVGDAIGQVFLQRASVAKYDNTLPNVTIKTYNMLISVSVFPLLMLAVFAPQIFGIFLGAKWVEAGAYVRLIVPITLFSFAYAPLSCLFSITDKQDSGLYLRIFDFIITTGIFLVCARNMNAKYAIACYATAKSISVFVRMGFILKYSGVSLREYMKCSYNAILKNILLSLPVLVIWVFTSNLWASVVITAVMSALYAKDLLRLVKEMQQN